MSDKQTVKFGDICREVKLTTKDPIADGYERYIGLEHLDSGSLKIKRWGMIAEDNPSFTRVFKKGHILFGKRRPYLKKAAIAEFDGICSGDIIVMESKGNAIVKCLLPYIISSDGFWDFAIKTSSGSLSPRTKFKSIAEYDVSVLDSSAQKTLIESLSLISRVTELKEETSRMTQELFEVLFRNELFELSGEPIFNADHSTVKFDVQDTTLGDVLTKIVDCEHKTAPYTKEKTQYLVVRTNNVKKGCIDYEDIKTTDKNSFEAWTKRKLPEAGDIIFTREAPAGESCIIPKNIDVCLGQRTVLLIPNREQILPEFLSRYLNTRFCRHYIEKYIVGTTVERINISDIPRLRVLLPSMERQKKIVDLVTIFELFLSENKNSLNTLSQINNCLVERV